MPKNRRPTFQVSLQYWLSQLYSVLHLLKTTVVHAGVITQAEAEVLSLLPISLRFIQNGWIVGSVFVVTVLIRSLKLQHTHHNMQENTTKLYGFLHSEKNAFIDDQNHYQRWLHSNHLECMVRKITLSLSYFTVYYTSTFEFIRILSHYTPYAVHVILMSESCIALFSLFFALHITQGQFNLLNAQQNLAHILDHLITQNKIAFVDSSTSQHVWKKILTICIAATTIALILLYPNNLILYAGSLATLALTAAITSLHIYKRYKPFLFSSVYALSVGGSSLLSIASLVHCHPAILFIFHPSVIQALHIEHLIIAQHTVLSVLYASCMYHVQQQGYATRALIAQLPDTTLPPTTTKKTFSLASVPIDRSDHTNPPNHCLAREVKNTNVKS